VLYSAQEVSSNPGLRLKSQSFLTWQFLIILAEFAEMLGLKIGLIERQVNADKWQPHLDFFV
jgi:hypothetical protein